MKNCMEHSQPGGLSIVIIQAILFMQKFGYGMMEQVLIRRTYHIFLIAFIVVGAQ